MNDIYKAFEKFCSGYDLYGDEWQDMGLDKVFAAGYKAALHQQEQAEPVGWREAMQEFVDRCDRGEVRSTYTYNKFKALLAAAPQPKETGE